MKKSEKILLDLINLQMQPFSIHYDSIPEIPYEFYLTFETTREQEAGFIKQADEYLKRKRKSKKERGIIIDNFILDYGLKTKREV